MPYMPIKTINRYPIGTLNQKGYVVAGDGVVNGKIQLDKVIGTSEGAIYGMEYKDSWALPFKWLNTPLGNFYEKFFENATGVDYYIRPNGIGIVKDGVVQSDYKLLGFSLVAEIPFDNTEKTS